MYAVSHGCYLTAVLFQHLSNYVTWLAVLWQTVSLLRPSLFVASQSPDAKIIHCIIAVRRHTGHLPYTWSSYPTPAV